MTTPNFNDEELEKLGELLFLLGQNVPDEWINPEWYIDPEVNSMLERLAGLNEELYNIFLEFENFHTARM